MKRAKLIKYLGKNNYILLREGSKHSMFYNAFSGDKTTIPRHDEINTFLAQKICKDLGINKPEFK